MTVWVELENEDVIRNFVGREFAMTYGDYEREAKQIGKTLGLQAFQNP